MMIEITVNKKGRIDKVLLEELVSYKISRSFLQKLITNGKVLVNNNLVANSHNVQIGDFIQIDLPEEEETIELIPQNIDFRVVYEDDDIIIIDKPNNLVVHPSITCKKNTLVNGLLYKFKNLSDINGKIRPGIVHRIDKQTTGLLVVAKNNDAHRYLERELKDKKIKRYYYALVYGTFEHKTGLIKAPIGRDSKNRKKMAVQSNNSKQAVTFFKILKEFKKFSLIECELETGRTHQIRIHMQYILHPIFGDNIYGRIYDRNNSFGQYLHAYKLELVHPTTKKLMTFTADLPKEFADKIEELEKE